MTASTSDSRVLVDTNILVYAYDPSEPSKHVIVRELVERLTDEGRLVLSAQVLNEFCAVMMHAQRATPWPPAQVETTLRRLAATGEVVPVTASFTFRALGAMHRHGLSFWDALIRAAAAENGAAMIYTENFQDGRDVDGVRFVNPFLVTQSPAS